MLNDIKNLFASPGFDFALSIDCEGPIFDKNLENNVKNLENLLKLTTDNNIYVILFITPYFAEMMNKLQIVDNIKNNYNVIFGLHIHPNNLPPEIQKHCPFAKESEDLLAAYSLEEQQLLIKHSMNYLESQGISPIQIFRGGYFSVNDNTEKALIELTDIKFESHNVYREQYMVTSNLLTPVPVYAFNDREELRLEYFDTDKLKLMLKDAIKENKKVLSITHSYLLDPNDFHYVRDNIDKDIHFRLSELIKVINENNI